MIEKIIGYILSISALISLLCVLLHIISIDIIHNIALVNISMYGIYICVCVSLLTCCIGYILESDP